MQGVGLIKVKNEYINPNQVVKFSQDSSDNNKTKVSCSGLFYNSHYMRETKYYPEELKVNCSADKFAEAFLEAQTTGKIVDINA